MFLLPTAALLLISVGQESAPPEGHRSLLDHFAPSITAEARTQVLVLGTPHLDTVDGFQRDMLGSLLDTLAEWGPDAICVEALPGRTIDTMRAEEALYGPALQQFASTAIRLGPRAQEYMGTSRLEAEALLREADGEELDSSSRGFLALAALDVPTATLHAARARAEGAELPQDAPPALVNFLAGKAESHNEIDCLAVPLALRLGLARLDPVDDHLDKDDFLRLADALMSELADSGELAAASAARVYVDSAADLAQALEQGDLLPHYLHLAGATFGTADVRAQWDVFLRTRLTSGRDRARLALWDVRNLAIAGHVRRVTARFPGGRVLVVIGAGHRPFLEALLETSLDVRIVNLAEIAAGSGEARHAR